MNRLTADDVAYLRRLVARHRDRRRQARALYARVRAAQQDFDLRVNRRQTWEMQIR